MVEAPTAVLSGDPQEGEGFVFLLGQTRLLEPAELARLYPGGPEEQCRRFEAAVEVAVSAGFLLAQDAGEICALAHHGRPPSGWLGAEREGATTGAV